MNKKNNEGEKRTSSKKPTKLDEDITLEIINSEFKDLEDWLKKKIKGLKGESFQVIDSLKLKNDDQLYN